MVALNGVTRTNYGSALHAMGHYCYLDYERTLLDKYNENKLKFELVREI